MADAGDRADISNQPVEDQVTTSAEIAPMNCGYPGCSAEAGDEWGHDHTAERVARWRECPVPTAFDHPDCRACQMWEDAGASWPRPCAEHYGGEADE